MSAGRKRSVRLPRQLLSLHATEGAPLAAAKRRVFFAFTPRWTSVCPSSTSAHVISGQSRGTRQSFAYLGIELSGIPFECFSPSVMASGGRRNVLPRA